jgi:hypothetical protein
MHAPHPDMRHGALRLTSHPLSFLLWQRIFSHQTGASFPPQPIFITWPPAGPVPIETGAPAKSWVARVALPAHHTELLRRPARCSVITQRARMQQRPSSAPASLSACAALCFVARVRASREEKNGLPHPGRESRGYLHAGGEKRGHLAAAGRQTKWGGCREGPLASDIGSFSHGRAAPTLGAQDCIA